MCKAQPELETYTMLILWTLRQLQDSRSGQFPHISQHAMLCLGTIADEERSDRNVQFVSVKEM